MNKHERTLAGKKVVARRARKLGFKKKLADLPAATRVALQTTGDIRISQRSDRKRFGKSSRKQTYGHFCGHNFKGLGRKDLVERAVVKSWRDHDMMWVIGCIDAQGAIVASPSRESRTHRPEESRGKRWRWCVWSQEFIFAGPRTAAELNQPPEPLDDAEAFAVCDWLIRHGYADERCLPTPSP